MSAGIVPVGLLTPEQRSSLAWMLVSKKLAQGEELRETLLWAIRNGARLPDSLESRAWLADALEGKLDPKRDRGRPEKQQRKSMVDLARERGIVEAYRRWFDAFGRDRELAWLQAEGQRIHREYPEAEIWNRGYDLGREEERQAFARAIAVLGALPCPQALKGGDTPREFALRATAEEYGSTPAVVARILTRANKSK